MAPRTPQRLRVLCLHGWRTNARILRDQSLGLQRALGPRAEFVFLDAPYAASGPPHDEVLTHFGHTAPFFEWWNAIPTSQGRDGGQSPEAPGDGPSRRFAYRYEGVDGTLDFVAQRIQDLGPIDVLLGFSQGAGLATVLSAHWATTRGAVPWRANVLVAGFRPRAAEVQNLFEGAHGEALPVELPSIHVLGQADELYQQGEALYETYAAEADGFTRLRFVHDEGHRFPTPSRHGRLYEEMASGLMRILS